MNEVLKTIAGRYSCRAYESRLPSQPQLDAIAAAAVQAPSAMNRQPWRVAVICDKTLIEQMDAEGMRILGEGEDKTAYERFMQRGGTLFYGAPCMFLVLQQAGTELDTGIVAQNIALAAHSLGLGSVICGMARIPLSGPNGDAFCRRVGIGEGWEFGMAVLVGYAAAPGAPHPADMDKVRYIR